jgi:hypothetical protein
VKEEQKNKPPLEEEEEIWPESLFEARNLDNLAVSHRKSKVDIQPQVVGYSFSFLLLHFEYFFTFKELKGKKIYIKCLEIIKWLNC